MLARSKCCDDDIASLALRFDRCFQDLHQYGDIEVSYLTFLNESKHFMLE
jgi:hypothetical protein